MAEMKAKKRAKTMADVTKAMRKRTLEVSYSGHIENANHWLKSLKYKKVMSPPKSDYSRDV